MRCTTLTKLSTAKSREFVWYMQSADECSQCKHLLMGTTCVAQCPTTHYNDSNGMCQTCHPFCSPDSGCSGPLNGIGPGRCLDCSWVRLAADAHTIEECLPPTTHECPEGFYEKPVNVPLNGLTHRSASTHLRRVIYMFFSRLINSCDLWIINISSCVHSAPLSFARMIFMIQLFLDFKHNSKNL